LAFGLGAGEDEQLIVLDVLLIESGRALLDVADAEFFSAARMVPRQSTPSFEESSILDGDDRSDMRPAMSLYPT
jgi:hypothetical protein